MYLIISKVTLEHQKILHSLQELGLELPMLWSTLFDLCEHDYPVLLYSYYRKNIFSLTIILITLYDSSIQPK